MIDKKNPRSPSSALPPKFKFLIKEILVAVIFSLGLALVLNDLVWGMLLGISFGLANYFIFSEK